MGTSGNLFNSKVNQIRNSKSETNRNYRIPNDKDTGRQSIRSSGRTFIGLRMIGLENSNLTFGICFGFRNSDFKFFADIGSNPLNRNSYASTPRNRPINV
ncbi:MAG: hypothetical protein CMJ48_05655 [Planctomycetaceae bacterium]|nr:hypothetical protein [Planctomycetaceae bacterium]